MAAMESYGGVSEALILRALVRMLMSKGLLSEDDVRAFLLDAANNAAVNGGSLTKKAAQDIVKEDLAPAFIGR
jgi:hypothetical protein